MTNTELRDEMWNILTENLESIGHTVQGKNKSCDALMRLYQQQLEEKDAVIFRLRADLASAMGHMEGCGHPYEYLTKKYPEFSEGLKKIGENNEQYTRSNK